jgi:hypothetical protein
MIRHFALIAMIAAGLGACQTAQLPQPAAQVGAAGFGLTADGDCVSRQVQVVDPSSGGLRDVTQRFCGNTVRIVR